MLEYIAVILFAAGIFFLVQGLREKYQSGEIYRAGDVHDPDLISVEKPESGRKVDVKGGGVILIGPIPIVFGESKYAVLALILTIFLMILAITLTVVI